MLNKSRSHRKNSLKYALILPLLVGFTFLFNVKTEAQVKSIDSIQEDSNKYGPVVYDKERSGDFSGPRVSSVGIKDTANNTPHMQPPFYIGDSIPLYIVGGREISKTEFELINPDSIASINVWKGQQAIDIYGQKGKNGVVVISLKKEYSSKIDTSPRVKDQASEPKLNLEDENPLIILDGKETSKSNFEKLKPEDIESVNVWKGQKAIQKYGDKAKDGAIEVETKGEWTVGYGKMPSNPEKLNAFEGYQQMKRSKEPNINKALIFIDDVESSINNLKSLKLNQIESTMTVQPEDTTAIKQYGDKAKNGLIKFYTEK